MKEKVANLMETTQRSEEEVCCALYECDNDLDRAVIFLFETLPVGAFETSSKKKKNRLTSTSNDNTGDEWGNESGNGGQNGQHKNNDPKERSRSRGGMRGGRGGTDSRGCKIYMWNNKKNNFLFLCFKQGEARKIEKMIEQVQIIEEKIGEQLEMQIEEIAVVVEVVDLVVEEVVVGEWVQEEVLIRGTLIGTAIKLITMIYHLK